MNIERLKEIRDFLSHSLFCLGRRSGKTIAFEVFRDIEKLIDEAIARQSVTSEDVQRAIGDLLDMKEHWCADSTDNDAISIDLAIAALQQYQPKGE